MCGCCSAEPTLMIIQGHPFLLCLLPSFVAFFCLYYCLFLLLLILSCFLWVPFSMINRLRPSLFFPHLPVTFTLFLISSSLFPISEWLLLRLGIKRQTEHGSKKEQGNSPVTLLTCSSPDGGKDKYTHRDTQKDILFEADITELTWGHSQMTLLQPHERTAMNSGLHGAVCVQGRISENLQNVLEWKTSPPPAASGRCDSNPTGYRWKSQ